MNPKETKALKAFQSGMNCAQSVLLPYSGDYKFDDHLAYQISSGFGGGMGRLQKTCGAVTGAFMVLGIYNCKKYGNHKLQTDNNRILIQEFNRKFLLKHNSTNCDELIGCNLNTDDGQTYAEKNKVKERICEKCIIDAIEIVDSLINNSK